jgi:hypothetical protein
VQADVAGNRPVRGPRRRCGSPSVLGGVVVAGGLDARSPGGAQPGEGAHPQARRPTQHLRGHGAGPTRAWRGCQRGRAALPSLLSSNGVCL